MNNLITMNWIAGNSNYTDQTRTDKTPANHEFVYRTEPVLPCKFMKQEKNNVTPTLTNDFICETYYASGIKWYRVKFKSEQARLFWCLLDSAYKLTYNWRTAVIIVINKNSKDLNKFIYGTDTNWRINDSLEQQTRLKREES